MKKIAILLAGVLLALGLAMFAGCGDNAGDEFDPDAGRDTENVFFDDLTEGVRSEYWNIGNSK